MHCGWAAQRGCTYEWELLSKHCEVLVLFYFYYDFWCDSQLYKNPPWCQQSVYHSILLMCSCADGKWSSLPGIVLSIVLPRQVPRCFVCQWQHKISLSLAVGKGRRRRQCARTGRVRGRATSHSWCRDAKIDSGKLTTEERSWEREQRVRSR